MKNIGLKNGRGAFVLCFADGKPAIRVDLAGSAEDGLEFSGTGIIQKNGEAYHVLLFMAPKEHYFGALLGEFNQLAGSS